jgi:LAO/AO transport system kinase
MTFRHCEPRGSMTGADLKDRILARDRRALARAITLMESGRADHRAEAWRFSTRSRGGAAGASHRAFGDAGRGQVHLHRGLRHDAGRAGACRSRCWRSIRPRRGRAGRSSATRRGWSGWRASPAFIRPSPSQTALGGVARRTREAMALCEAAGFDVVIVETVGVGQSETMAAEMTDLFVLLMAPAAGRRVAGREARDHGDRGPHPREQGRRRPEGGGHADGGGLRRGAEAHAEAARGPGGLSQGDARLGGGGHGPARGLGRDACGSRTGGRRNGHWDARRAAQGRRGSRRTCGTASSRGFWGTAR